MQIVEPYDPNSATQQEIYIASRIPSTATVDTTTYDLWMIDLETRDRYAINYTYSKDSYYEKISTFFTYSLYYSGSGLKEHRMFSLELVNKSTKQGEWKGNIICLSSAAATPENTAIYLLRNRPPSYKTPDFPDERTQAGSDGGDYIIYE